MGSVLPMAAKQQRDESAPVSFRLDSLYKQMLEERSETGVSLHMAARDLLMEALDKQAGNDFDIKTVASQVTQVAREVQELRTDVAVAVQALLVASGRVTSEEAEQWVSQTLLQKED